MRTLKLLGLNTLISVTLCLGILSVGTPIALIYSEWLPKTLLWSGKQLGLLDYRMASGNLSDGWYLEKLSIGSDEVESEGFNLEIESLKVMLSSEWRFSALWDGTVKWRTLEGIEDFAYFIVDEVGVTSITLRLPSKERVSAIEEPSFLYKVQTLELPDVELPIKFSVKKLTIGTLEIATNGRVEHITDFELEDFSLERAGWAFSSLSLESDWGVLTGSGKGQLLGNWPFELESGMRTDISDHQGAMQKPLGLLDLGLFSTELKVNLRGTLDRYRAELALSSGATKAGQVADDLTINVDIEGGRDSVVLERAQLTGPLGELAISASAIWNSSQKYRPMIKGVVKVGLIKMDVESFLKNLRPQLKQLKHPLLTPVDVNLSASFQVQPRSGVARIKDLFTSEQKGSNNWGHWWVQAELSRLNTQLLGEPFEMSGHFSGGFKKPTSLNEIALKWGERGERLSVNGSLSRHWNLIGHGAFDAMEVVETDDSSVLSINQDYSVGQYLNELGLGGMFSGRFKLNGPLDNPNLMLRAEVTDLSWKDRALSRKTYLDIDGALDGLQVSLDMNEGAVEQSLLSSVVVRRHLGRVSIDGKLAEWRLKDPFQADDEAVWTLRDEVPWRVSDRRVFIQMSDLCLDLHNSAICAKRSRYSAGKGELKLVSENWLLSRWKPPLPTSYSVSGDTRSRLSIRWNRSDRESSDHQVEVLAEVDAPLVEWRYHDEKSGTTQAINVREAKVSVEYQLTDAIRLKGRGLVGDEGKVSADIAIDPRRSLFENSHVTLSRIDLAPFRPWMVLPEQVQGFVDLEATLNGPLRDPDITARFESHDLFVNMIRPRLNFKDFRVVGTIDNGQLALEGKGKLNDGPLTLTLDSRWRDKENIGAWITLTGQKIYLNLEGYGELWISPKIEVDYRDRVIDLSGNVSLPKADIEVTSPRVNRVGLSPDVLVVDQQSDHQRIVDSWLKHTLVDVDVHLGRDVKFNGFGVKGRLEGELNIRRDQRKILMGNGVVNLLQGQYKAYGQDLVISKGQLLFSGPVSLPRLDLEAVRVVDPYNVTAGLRLQGLARSPIATLFSTPTDPFADLSQQPVSDSEILSFLVLGRPARQEQEGTLNEKQAVTQAALSLGIAKSGLAKRASEVLGVDNLELSTDGSGDDAQLVVGGDLSERLFLQYAMGLFAPTNSIILRYRVNQRFYFEALSGLERALDLFYSFDF